MWYLHDGPTWATNRKTCPQLVSSVWYLHDGTVTLNSNINIKVRYALNIMKNILMAKKITLGIDLGTTHSVVALCGCDGLADAVQILSNSTTGSPLIPSCVAFTSEDGLIIGEPALQHAQRNPSGTIRNVKRLMGQRFSSEDANNSTFKDDGAGQLQIVLRMPDGTDKAFYPEEISAMILRCLKRVVYEHIGAECECRAVITVPAYFNDAQRRATQDAAEIAGIDVIRIINEPTAAALAFGLTRQDTSSLDAQNILVFDLGGGTLDITVLSITPHIGVYEVMATGGDSHLGGEDMDLALCHHFATEFEQKYKRNVPSNSRAWHRLLRQCESVKRSLSYAKSASLEVETLLDGIDFVTSITRARFESLCSGIFDRCQEITDQVLLDAMLDRRQIHEVVLVGGCSRIPRIKQFLEHMFDRVRLNTSMHPEESIAYGAAVAAMAEVDTNNNNDDDGVVLLDVTPLSLGIETEGNCMHVLIPRNSPLPAIATSLFTNTEDDQERVQVNVYEGERTFVTDCNLLGNMELCDIPPGPRGSAQIELSLNVDTNGILRVSATDRRSGKTSAVTLQTGRLSRAKVAQLIKESQAFCRLDYDLLT